MNLADRLLAESAHLRQETDPGLDALRRALLAEDVLGITLTDAQIVSGAASDALVLGELAVVSAPHR